MAVALNRDMGPVARLPLLGGLPAAVLDALPAPRTPEMVADVPHQAGLPEARHALLCMNAAEGGMSMVVTVSLQHVKDVMQQQRPYAPLPWEESAPRWLHVQDLPPTHTVGHADMGKLEVLAGAEYWACVRVSKGGLQWLSSMRAGSGAISPGDQPAMGFTGNVTGSWAPCAGRKGARPGNPTGAGRVRGGDEAAVSPGARRVARGHEQNVAR